MATSIKVGQVMTRTVRTCTPEDTLELAAQIMWEFDCGVVPVVREADDGGEQLAGIVTDRDVCMAALFQGRALRDIPVSVAMSRDVLSCVPTDPLSVALSVLETNQLRRLPVVEGDARLVGLLSLADCARDSARTSAATVGPSDLGRVVVAVSRSREAIAPPAIAAHGVQQAR